MNILKQIKSELKTQNNCYTADPIFLVQEQERIYGMDPEYAEEYIWYDVENCEEASDEEVAELDRLDDELERIPSRWIKSYYFDKWMTVQSFFTKKAAQEYVDTRYYRHTGKLRVYVDSLYNNPEMKAVRDFILNYD